MSISKLQKQESEIIQNLSSFHCSCACCQVEGKILKDKLQVIRNEIRAIKLGIKPKLEVAKIIVELTPPRHWSDPQYDMALAILEDIDILEIVKVEVYKKLQTNPATFELKVETHY
jgi:hypothetical protein